MKTNDKVKINYLTLINECVTTLSVHVILVSVECFDVGVTIHVTCCFAWFLLTFPVTAITCAEGWNIIG